MLARWPARQFASTTAAVIRDRLSRVWTPWKRGLSRTTTPRTPTPLAKSTETAPVCGGGGGGAVSAPPNLVVALDISVAGGRVYAGCFADHLRLRGDVPPGR
jgi:hypothetical protein